MPVYSLSVHPSIHPSTHLSIHRELWAGIYPVLYMFFLSYCFFSTHLHTCGGPGSPLCPISLLHTDSLDHPAPARHGKAAMLLEMRPSQSQPCLGRSPLSVLNPEQHNTLPQHLYTPGWASLSVLISTECPSLAWCLMSLSVSPTAQDPYGPPSCQEIPRVCSGSLSHSSALPQQGPQILSLDGTHPPNPPITKCQWNTYCALCSGQRAHSPSCVLRKLRVWGKTDQLLHHEKMRGVIKAPQVVVSESHTQGVWTFLSVRSSSLPPRLPPVSEPPRLWSPLSALLCSHILLGPRPAHRGGYCCPLVHV